MSEPIQDTSAPAAAEATAPDPAAETPPPAPNSDHTLAQAEEAKEGNGEQKDTPREDFTADKLVLFTVRNINRF